jgi:hypothetical protein
MKTDKETQLFRVLTGSHLYGTATETSDFDYKAVCLPKLDDLLLNKQVSNRKEKPEGVKASDKMVAGETETEYLPLQVFFNDFFAGQTYALEVAFAVRNGKFEVNVPYEVEANRARWSLMMGELIDGFLTSNVKKMVGYAVSQSKLYGLKTERFTTLREVLRLLNESQKQWSEEGRQRVRLLDIPETYAEMLKVPHVKEVQIFNANGGSDLAPALEVCGKQYPLTNQVHTVVKSMEKVLGGYGARVESFEGEGVDWKALSHAIRITEQVLELSATGELRFPRPNAPFLLAVKQGKYSVEEATRYLQERFEQVDQAVMGSVLQEKTPALEQAFEEWKIHVLKGLYNL